MSLMHRIPTYPMLPLATFLKMSAAEDGSRRNMSKKKRTGRSQVLLMLVVFVTTYSFLQEEKVLHSVKMSNASSTSWKVGMSGLDQDQADSAEVARNKSSGAGTPGCVGRRGEGCCSSRVGGTPDAPFYVRGEKVFGRLCGAHPL
jgi:hypothetical protein